MILPRLRAGTAAAHQMLEDEVRIAETLLSRERYRRLLEKFFGFHGPLEERLLALPGWGETPHRPAERSKEAWLAEDLSALGLAPEEISALPRCTDLPAAATLAAAYGCAYVLEGSTLGGRHILHLPSAEGLPRRFFTGYGEATGPRWKEFCASLEAAPEVGDDTVRAASETFERLRAWLRD